MRMLWCWLFLLCAMTANAADAQVTTSIPAIPPSAAEARPLTVGSTAPLMAALLRPDGRATTLAAEVDGKPTVLVFYRGGWCPFCTRQLAGLGTITADLAAHGWRVLALSPETAAAVAESASKSENDGINRLADTQALAMRAFDVAYHLDDQTQEKMKGYGVPLLILPGYPRGVLPVPSVFLLDAAGVIRFVHADPDFRTRISTDAVRAAAATIMNPTPAAK
jgi:peroxiredoxin